MTAAGAFFSIALTLNITGVRLTSVRLSDLRPEAVRSYMERQWTMASVPIVRYYDHLRFVYEVKSKVRELRGESGGEGNGELRRDETQPVTPGETKQNPGQSPGRNDGGSRTDPRQEPNNLVIGPATEPEATASDDFVEASLAIQGIQGSSATLRTKSCPWGIRSVQSGGPVPQRLSAVAGDRASAMRAWERSRVWIA
jgi:hypothetical protein